MSGAAKMKRLGFFLIDSDATLYVWMTAFMALLLGSGAGLPVDWLAYVVLAPILLACVVAILGPIARIGSRH